MIEDEDEQRLSVMMIDFVDSDDYGVGKQTVRR